MDLLTWSRWYPLEGCWRGMTISALKGLYRIRCHGEDRLDYIGQTGLGLRKRLAMLKGIYGHLMPYRDPHIAAPALWALRHKSGCEFEVSVAVVEGSTPWRKDLEAVAIALYRQEYGESPLANFGRIIAGYRMSSGNNARLDAAGRRFRGGLSSQTTASPLPSIPPFGPLSGDPVALNWCGHRWSKWSNLPGAVNTGSCRNGPSSVAGPR